MARDAPDVAAVHMHADRDAVVVRVRHAMDVAGRWRQHVDVAGPQRSRLERAHRLAGGAPREALRDLAAAQHADQRPHRVIVDRGLLPRAPDEAHDREAVGGIGVQQVLLVVLRMRPGVLRGQPVVARDQRREQFAAARQQPRLVVRRLVDEAREVRDELAEPGRCFRHVVFPASIPNEIGFKHGHTKTSHSGRTLRSDSRPALVEALRSRPRRRPPRCRGCLT